MKHFILLFIVFSIFLRPAETQTPQLIKYQAVVRNSSGQTIQNRLVSLRISILQGTVEGPVVYSEVQADSSNEFGLINVNIGGGSPVIGTFASIDWSAGPSFLKTEVDPQAGTNYSLEGISQLLSVPYALYAGKSSGADSKFEVLAHNQYSSDSALFVVRDRNGNPVFTVFENGVEVTYDQSVKGAKGGFAVGGRKSSKGSVQNILTVNSDSVRIYIDSTQSKGAKGGFVVGGRTSGKGESLDYFKIGGNASADTSANTVTILKNGNVGINKTNPSEALDIGTGWATVAPGFGWLTPSDYRYKTKIISLTGMLQRVMQLRPVQYDLITENPSNEGSPRHIGFIAQEIEPLFPEFVVTNSEGYKSVAYDKLTPVLTEAIKEQQLEIEALKMENARLKLRLEVIDSFESRLRILEKSGNK